MSDVPYKDYVDARMADHASVHHADARALQAAVEASSTRFESVNEFRATLSEQAGSFVTRTEMDARLRGMSDKLDSVSATATRSAIGAGIAGGVLGLIGGAIVSRMLQS